MGSVQNVVKKLITPGLLMTYLFLIATLTVIMTGMAIGEINKDKPKESKKWLIASIVINCVVVALFTYTLIKLLMGEHRKDVFNL